MTPGRETVCSAPVFYRGVAQSGSAFGSGPKSREFKSHRPDFEISGHLPPDGDHFLPNADHIFPDSGNFWSFRQVFGSFGHEDHWKDHLKGGCIIAPLSHFKSA